MSEAYSRSHRSTLTAFRSATVHEFRRNRDGQPIVNGPDLLDSERRPAKIGTADENLWEAVCR